MKPLPTLNRLRELLRYVRKTGLFYWRKQCGPASPGSEAGNSQSAGYRQIGIDKRYYYAHRLAWLYVHGVEPIGDIDHINGNPADNRIANLRECPRSKNAHSTRRRRNASGFRGVSRCTPGCWRARIMVNGKRLFLGSYKTPEEAARAYDKAARHYFGEFARTNAELFGLKLRKNSRVSAIAMKRGVSGQRRRTSKDSPPRTRTRWPAPDRDLEVPRRSIVPQDLLCLL